MNFNEFSSWFRPMIVFGTKDILKIYPQFNSVNLTNWQQAEYIIKIAKGFYTFGDLIIDKPLLYFASNKIVSHSYVSCESAIEHYGIGSLYDTITSVCPQKSHLYKSEFVGFKFHMMSNYKLISNIRLLKSKNYIIRMAIIEKAIADYFYFNSEKQTRADIRTLNFKKENISQQVNPEKLLKISSEYENKSFNERIRNFLNVFHNKYQ